MLTWLLEFKGKGPVDDVKWMLKSFPRFHLISKIAKRADRQEAEEEAAERVLKGLLELPGNLLPDK